MPSKEDSIVNLPGFSVVEAVQWNPCWLRVRFEGHMDTVQKVDVFVPSDEPYAGEQMSRRRKITLEPVSTASFFVSAPEDTVLAKLLWFRKGGRVSDRQWRDILGVLKVQSTHLDRTYLDLWAARLTVGDLLKEALVDAGLSL